MHPRKGSEEPYLGPAALIGLQVRNCWFGGRASLCEHLRRVAPDEGNRLDMDECRQVDKRQMDAAERMNSLEGVSETAPSPPFKRARLRKPLHGEQEKTGKDETELVMKSRGSPRSSTGSSILDKMSTRSRSIILINYPRELFPCTEKRNVFNGTGG